LISNKLIQN